MDVQALKSRLRLTLNLRFHQLHDPRGLAKDVTNLGRWGNGDAEVNWNELDDLPYVMGLVRQAFEMQMGNGTVEEIREALKIAYFSHLCCIIRVVVSGGGFDGHAGFFRS